jgi:hypothetical protein
MLSALLNYCSFSIFLTGWGYSSSCLGMRRKFGFFGLNRKPVRGVEWNIRCVIELESEFVLLQTRLVDTLQHIELHENSLVFLSLLMLADIQTVLKLD